MLLAIILTILTALLWSIAVILIGYEIPFAALFIGVISGWTCSRLSTRLKIPVAMILTVVGVILGHYLIFTFFFRFAPEGFISLQNVRLFFGMNSYVPGFWTVQDALWLIVAAGLSMLIVWWRTR